MYNRHFGSHRQTHTHTTEQTDKLLLLLPIIITEGGREGESCRRELPFSSCLVNNGVLQVDIAHAQDAAEPGGSGPSIIINSF